MARMTKVDTLDNVDFWKGSNNIFEDLGFADAEDRHTKLRLAFELNQVFARLRLSQASAARRLGINQPKISALKNYRLDGFSVERLMNFLTALSCDIEIIIKKKPRSTRPGKITISAA